MFTPEHVDAIRNAYLLAGIFIGVVAGMFASALLILVVGPALRKRSEGNVFSG